MHATFLATHAVLATVVDKQPSSRLEPQFFQLTVNSFYKTKTTIRLVRFQTRYITLTL